MKSAVEREDVCKKAVANGGGFGKAAGVERSCSYDSTWAESYARALKIEELADAFNKPTKAQLLVRYDVDYELYSPFESGCLTFPTGKSCLEKFNKQHAQ